MVNTKNVLLPSLQWRPAWTEEDVQVELTEQLTEEQVFALLAEEDDRKRDRTGTGSDSQNETSLLKPDGSIPSDGVGVKEGGGEEKKGSGEGGRGEEGDVCWFDEEGTFLNVEEEEIVDMQQENGGGSLNGQQ